MRTRMIAVVIVGLLGFAAGNASAMKGCDKGMHCDQGMMDCKCMDGGGKSMMASHDMAGRFRMMAEMLELNAEQRKAVEAIHSAHHKEVIRKEADIDVAKVELQEIMDKEPVNIAEAEQQIRAIATMKADLEVMHLKAKEAVKAKLTPEQVEKMKKHMAAGMAEKMEEMGGMEGCKMCDKTRKCNMMGHDSGEEKGAAMVGKGEKPRHPRHH